MLINTSRPGQNSRYFPEDIFIVLMKMFNFDSHFIEVCSQEESMQHYCSIGYDEAWHRLYDKPLSEPIITYVLTH